jgi:hypothetical protein
MSIDAARSEGSVIDVSSITKLERPAASSPASEISPAAAVLHSDIGRHVTFCSRFSRWSATVGLSRPLRSSRTPASSPADIEQSSPRTRADAADVRSAAFRCDGHYLPAPVMLLWLIGVVDILGGSRPTMPLPIYYAYRAQCSNAVQYRLDHQLKVGTTQGAMIGVPRSLPGPIRAKTVWIAAVILGPQGFVARAVCMDRVFRCEATEAGNVHACAAQR